MSLIKKLFSEDEMFIKGRRAAGYYKGFNLIAEETADSLLKIKIAFHVPEISRNALFDQFNGMEGNLRAEVKDLSVFNVNYTEVEIGINILASGKKNIQNAQIVLKRVMDVLTSCNCEAGCSSCGENKPVHYYAVENHNLCLCDGCYAKTVRECRKIEEERKNVKTIFWKGALTSLAAAVLIGLIYMVLLRSNILVWGFFLPIVPFVAFSYWGKKIDKISSIYLLILCNVVFYLSVKYGFNWNIASKLDGYSIFEVDTILNDLFDLFPEVKSDYISCMIKGFGLSALTTVLLSAESFFNKGKVNITKIK